MVLGIADIALVDCAVCSAHATTFSSTEFMCCLRRRIPAPQEDDKQSPVELLLLLLRSCSRRCDDRG